MNRKLTIALGTLLGIPLLALWLFVTVQPIKVLPRLKLAPGYSLISQQDRPFTSDMVRGQVVLYQFAHTSCGADCQSIWDNLQALAAQLPTATDAEIPVKLVIITVDPGHDSPQVLAEFGRQLGTDFARWTFLTGSESEISEVLRGGFGLAYKREADGKMSFLNRTVLVDGWGIVRAEYVFVRPSAEQLASDIQLVIDEARNSQGAARYAYEAAHLFGCYQTQG
jgi:protein SCO1/2